MLGNTVVHIISLVQIIILTLNKVMSKQKSLMLQLKVSSVLMIVKHTFFVVPKGNNPSIAPLLKTYGIGSFINLTCYATYQNTYLIDVDTNVNIQWLSSSNHTLHSYTSLNDYTEHTLNYTISNVKLSDAGQYTCQYNVSSNNSFVITSDVMRAVTNVSVQSKSIICIL